MALLFALKHFQQPTSKRPTPQKDQGEENTLIKDTAICQTPARPLVMHRPGWGETVTNAEHSATKVPVVQYDRPIPRSRCQEVCDSEVRTKKPNNPLHDTPVPPLLLKEASHQGD